MSEADSESLGSRLLAALAGSTPAFTPAPDLDYVWIGELSGFRVEHSWAGGVDLTHRCGWSHWIAEGEYMANLVMMTMLHRKEGCK